MSFQIVLIVTAIVWLTLMLHIMASDHERGGVKVVAFMVVTVSAQLVIGIAFLGRMVSGW